MFYVLHLTIWNLIIVSKSNLEWTGLLTFKLERPLLEKLKSKDLDRVFGMLLFFGSIKMCGFVHVRKKFILQLQS